MTQAQFEKKEIRGMDKFMATINRTLSGDPDPWKESREAMARTVQRRLDRLNTLRTIARVQGVITVDRAVLTFEDGSTLDLGPLLERAK